MHPTDDIRVDASSFVNAMNRFIALKKLTLQEGIRVQAGLLADELVRDTPPQKGTVNGKSLSARKAGEARVARDVRRAARPLVPTEWKSERLADLIRAKKYGPLQAAFERFSSDRILPFAPPVHQSARDSDGRVRRQLAQATPDYKEEAAYDRQARKRVGLAKGGWVASQLGLGRRVQAWLRPHAWVGSFEDHTGEAEPRLIMRNGSNWAGGRLAQIVIAKAMTRREGRMVRWIEGALAAQARKARLA